MPGPFLCPEESLQSKMSRYRKNHYVPVWFQDRFIPASARERKFHYLDLKPETCIANGQRYTRKALMNWGPRSCFAQQDLYTTQFGTSISTEIEQKFFGPVDDSAAPAIDYFLNFSHPSVDGEMFHTFLLYLSIQKLRTPKGLKYLSHLTRIKDNNRLLFELQQLQALFCAIWTESVWSIVDTKKSNIGFLLSDHPVSVYNQGCFPASKWCRDGHDPHIWLSGTHTLFPLSPEKMLVLTNLSWLRHPYGNPIRPRPNPDPLRPAVFNFTAIQTGRSLTTEETAQINYIIKQRAFRYIAAYEKDWLFPETIVGTVQWDQLGKSYLLMPDPRSVSFSTQIVMGYKNGRSDMSDEYGRKPWDTRFLDEQRKEREWETFHAFQGEYARRFGPVRRGRAFEFGKEDSEEDDDDFHRYHLSLEQKYKKHRYRP